MTMITVLSIAGYDPSGGAGILADIKTFAAFNCYGTAAITSLTSQNTQAVYGAFHQTPEVLRAQLAPILEDFTIAAVKTGMLPTRETIEVAAETIMAHRLPHVVVDPVIRSTSGYDLIDDEAVRHLLTRLLPLAEVITPNLAEAERLTGDSVRNLEEMKRAASRIRTMCQDRVAVLVKGGHLIDDATDVLFDGTEYHLFAGERIETRNTHGTGCTLSAAIAALLGQGRSLVEAVAGAKRYVERAIKAAPNLGHGAGPLNHMVSTKDL